jgi:hypothetical protein
MGLKIAHTKWHLARYRHHRGSWRLVCALLLAAVSALSSARAEDDNTVFFYSPETNINNYNALKTEFDGYFSRFGAQRFQPFSERETFEKFMDKSMAGLSLMSSWHYRHLANKVYWNPVLVGISKGRTTQKHILFAPKNRADLADLKGATVATSGTRDYTRTLLLDILGQDQVALVNSFKLLVVPKDIDALMSVSFGVAKAAVATESGADMLSRINPKQFGALVVIGASRESLLPILVVPQEPTPEHTAMIKIIIEMGADPEGRQRLMMLGLDGMQKLKPAEREGLLK